MKRTVRFVSDRTSKMPRIFLIVFLFAAPGLFASGGNEEAAKVPVNTGWTFCVTAFDVSTLPPHRQIIGESIARTLSNSLVALDYRFRPEEESAYYRNYALTKTRAVQAKALETKRNERDLLFYKGEPSWRYRKNLKTIDEAIAKLEEELAAIDADLPVVKEDPALDFSESNKKGTYPPPPGEGMEYRFCAEQKADAFLAGSVSEYHGRMYLKIKMYTLYSHSYSYEDSVLFSSEDLEDAMDEISGRLAGVVSGASPSAIVVRAEPPEAMALIDNSYAGLGETRSHSPGEAQIEVRADNFVPFSTSLELNRGELTDLFIDLTPLALNAFTADVSGSPGSSVYAGSLYVGKTPLTLKLPAASFAYISVETPEGETGSAVYRNNELVDSKARFVQISDTAGAADFLTRVPVSPEEKRVDRARRGFYGAYGAFWIALPVALFSAGIAGTYITANNYAVVNEDAEAYNRISGKAGISQYVQAASYGAIGVSLGITFFQIFRYLYVSGGDAAPIVKSSKPENTDPEAEN